MYLFRYTWPGRYEFQMNYFPSHVYLNVTRIKIQGKKGKNGGEKQYMIYYVVLNTFQQKKKLWFFLNAHLGSGAEGVKVYPSHKCVVCFYDLRFLSSFSRPSAFDHVVFVVSRHCTYYFNVFPTKCRNVTTVSTYHSAPINLLSTAFMASGICLRRRLMVSTTSVLQVFKNRQSSIEL